MGVMQYTDIIHDVMLLTGGSPTKQTPDYYSSLAKQYADKAMSYAMSSEQSAMNAKTYADEAGAVSKEVAIMRDVIQKYYEDTKKIAESIEEMQVEVITNEDIDNMMESYYGR